MSAVSRKSHGKEPAAVDPAAKIAKRLGTLETAAASLAEMQPTLTPALELIPCVSEVATVGQLLRSSARKLKNLRVARTKWEADSLQLTEEIDRLEHPEEEDKPVKQMVQRTAYRLNKADLRSKRSEKRLRHLKQRLRNYAHTDLGNVHASYVHELDSLQKYMNGQCNAFINLVPKPMVIKPFFAEAWPSIQSNSDDVVSLMSSGRDWFVEELSLVVNAAFVEVYQEFDSQLANFSASADYELSELRRELGQLHHLSNSHARFAGPKSILRPEQVTEFAQYSDYLTHSLEDITKAAAEIELRAQARLAGDEQLRNRDSAQEPQRRIEDLLEEDDTNAIRKQVDELQEALHALEDQSNQYFEDQEEGPDAVSQSVIASRLSAGILQLTKKIQGLQDKLDQAALRSGRQELQVDCKDAQPLFVVSLEEFPLRSPLPPSTLPPPPPDDD